MIFLFEKGKVKALNLE